LGISLKNFISLTGLHGFTVFGMKGNLKKTIVVVILAALTLAAFSMLLSPSARAETSEAKILSYSWHVAPANAVLPEYLGDLVAVGEIENVGSNVIGSVFVIGAAYNSTGAILDSNGADAYAYYLLPGQKAPFYIDFIPENSITKDQSWIPSVSNVNIEIGHVIDTNATIYSGLTSTVTSASNVDGAFTVKGIVQNTGHDPANNVWAITTFYNASGTVVSLNFTTVLSNSLAPGDSVPFTATPTDNSAMLSSEITNYSLLIQSTPPTTSASPSPSPSSPQTSFSTVLIYAVVGTVVIVGVAVAALAFLRKRRNLPPPPPPPPPSG
jgi:hypothetical protein